MTGTEPALQVDSTNSTGIITARALSKSDPPRPSSQVVSTTPPKTSSAPTPVRYSPANKAATTTTTIARAHEIAPTSGTSPTGSGEGKRQSSLGERARGHLQQQNTKQQRSGVVGSNSRDRTKHKGESISLPSRTSPTRQAASNARSTPGSGRSSSSRNLLINTSATSRHPGSGDDSSMSSNPVCRGQSDLSTSSPATTATNPSSLSSHNAQNYSVSGMREDERYANPHSGFSERPHASTSRSFVSPSSPRMMSYAAPQGHGHYPPVSPKSQNPPQIYTNGQQTYVLDSSGQYRPESLGQAWSPGYPPPQQYHVQYVPQYSTASPVMTSHGQMYSPAISSAPFMYPRSSDRHHSISEHYTGMTYAYPNERTTPMSEGLSMFSQPQYSGHDRRPSNTFSDGSSYGHGNRSYHSTEMSTGSPYTTAGYSAVPAYPYYPQQQQYSHQQQFAPQRYGPQHQQPQQTHIQMQQHHPNRPFHTYNMSGPLSPTMSYSGGYEQQSAQPHASDYSSFYISGEPQVYVPPIEVARGQLAQSRLHDAIYSRETKYSSRSPAAAMTTPIGAHGGLAMPKPPAHSPHALWVGNVPADTTHAELWRFFAGRPPPGASSPSSSSNASVVEGDVDLRSNGIESIHLIARSNCAFVNYASDVHLQHAIAVSNDIPLRPHDPRPKNLVCRVRKKEDDAKSGVGAQRIGGMHHAFVAARKHEETRVVKEAADSARETTSGSGQEEEDGRIRSNGETRVASISSVGGNSFSSTSTSSSYLARHFKKRYFILKSHDENDLHLSVERSLWATQSHNEPILHQAFNTATDVFLIFSANKSGCFFGYARMTSGISNDPKKRVSWSSREPSPNSKDSQDSSLDSSNLKESLNPNASKGSHASMMPRSSAILEENEDNDEPLEEKEEVEEAANGSQSPAAETSNGVNSKTLPILFSPSENRWLDRSPLSLSPAGGPTSESAPATLAPETKEAFVVGSTTLDPNQLRLPRLVIDDEAEPNTEFKARSAPVRTHRAVLTQQLLGGSDAPSTLGADGVRRKDMVISPLEKSERMGKLGVSLSPIETIEAALPESHEDSLGWGRPFSVKWLKVSTLPFSRCKHIRNEFNGNREVKISRDGTEVEPSAGAALIEQFDVE
ncbi:BQ5605_C009g05746 [Microbotryum silenes-dioicae]|uniref:BQ5605_C009g05746 protein n=1 Tax=Microbotryum silenes-dioicae TaxID=796604 RepID=A0A2X0N0Y6_9BASI|nr:BQ5605_C009g05746 [Microbotryum silenes-dioicae]